MSRITLPEISDHLSNDEKLQRVQAFKQELDMRDGTADGKVSKDTLVELMKAFAKDDLNRGNLIEAAKKSVFAVLLQKIDMNSISLPDIPQKLLSGSRSPT